MRKITWYKNGENYGGKMIYSKEKVDCVLTTKSEIRRDYCWFHHHILPTYNNWPPGAFMFLLKLLVSHSLALWKVSLHFLICVTFVSSYVAVNKVFCLRLPIDIIQVYQIGRKISERNKIPNALHHCGVSNYWITHTCIFIPTTFSSKLVFILKDVSLINI